jgi:flagellar biosynthesis protein FliQ
VEIDNSLFIMSEMLKTGVWIAAPVLAVSLVVGLLVSVIQVVTQIQEMTLTFVPKLIAAVVVLIVLGGWMLSKWMSFTLDLFASISG